MFHEGSIDNSVCDVNRNIVVKGERELVIPEEQLKEVLHRHPIVAPIFVDFGRKEINGENVRVEGSSSGSFLSDKHIITTIIGFIIGTRSGGVVS